MRKSVRRVLCGIGLVVTSTLLQAQEAPFTVNTNMFNQNNTETLDLQTAPGTETITVYEAAPGNDHYTNGVVMTAFKGKLYCQWQSSAVDEDAPDTWVAYSVSENGTTWSSPKVLQETVAEGHCTSGGWWVNGDTLVAYINVWYDATSPRGGWTYFKTSTDGENWTSMQRVRMTDGDYLNGIFEQDPHALPGGRIINATHLQPGIKAHPIYTDDPSGVRGWKLGAYSNLEHSGDVSREIEPSWFYQKDGDAVMVFRDQSSSYVRWASVSSDKGETWSTAVATNMPDSRSKQSAGNLPDGTAYLVGCPKSDKYRWPLAVTTSADGEYFDKAFLLRAGGNDLPDQKYTGLYKTLGYSYPKSMVYDGYLYVAYTTNKEDVQFTRVPLTELNQNCKQGFLDDCGRCINSQTSYGACAGKIEAETACEIDGILLESRNGGFKGEGYMNTTNAVGSYASWIINSTKAQTATISFRYANGGTTSRDGDLTVNGTAAGSLTLPSTGGWEVWEYASVNLQLEQGANEIIATATTADGLANIDLIAFSEGISDAQCGTITVLGESNSFDLEVYPNPVQNTLSINKEVAYMLGSISGELITTGTDSSIDTSTLPNGIYLLKIEGEVFKVIKE